MNAGARLTSAPGHGSIGRMKTSAHDNLFENLSGWLCALLFLAASPFPGTPARASEVPQVRTQAPGFYRMMLGDFEVTVLLDGTMAQPVDKLVSKPDEVRKVLARDHETLPIDLSVNAFLINTGRNLVLVDAGVGELFGPKVGGQLPANLRAAGYKPGEIDAVLITHLHGDHFGGLVAGGQRAFPNAVVYLDKRETAYWLDADQEKAAPENRKRSFGQARAVLGQYAGAGKLQTFDGASELFPGIRSMPAYGHTPGHTAYLVESRGERLLMWGDVIHCAEAQFHDPGLTMQYDSDPRAAAATRRSLMAAAAKDGWIVGSAHISFPGLGHVRSDGRGYSWIPLPYSVPKPDVK